MKTMIIFTQNENPKKINFNDKIKKLYLVDLDKQIVYKGNLLISSYSEGFLSKDINKHNYFNLSDSSFDKILSLNFNRDVKNKKFIDFIKNNEIEEYIV